MIALTIVGSGGVNSKNIPNFVSITSSVASTIFYTIDGSEPTLKNSYVYTQPIPISETLEIITIYAFAINADGDVSEMFAQTFIADEDNPSMPFYRKGSATILQPGVTINKPDEGLDIPNAVDADGEETAFQDKVDSEYEIVEDQSAVITVSVTPSGSTGTRYDDAWVPSSNLSDTFFNPKARVIYIDADNPDNPIEPIMRMFGSFANLVKYQGGQQLTEFGPPVSGGLMRTQYSTDTGRRTSYYYDNIALNFIIIDRQLRDGEYNLNVSRPAPWGKSKGVGLIFQWNYPGRGNMV